ncbi:MAG: hypothetical protein R3320_10130 [Nitriliruptorales bacterium]|nr:hypothetical protein [Nitriliruptorales bacterium]
MKVRRAAAIVLTPLTVLAMAFTAVPDGATAEDCRITDDGGTPDDDTDDKGVCTIRTWLNCDTAEEGKVATGLTGYPEFGLEPPPGSVTEGHGCGWPEIPLFGGVYQDTPYDFNFTGYPVGNIDSMTVELHDIHVGAGRAARTIPLEVRVSIDGKSPFGTTSIDNVQGEAFESPAPKTITVDLVASDTQASDSFRFTITNLGDVLGLDDHPGFGHANYHTVKVTIAPPSRELHGFVWGASEVPSGVIFNPDLSDPEFNAGTIVEAEAPTS